MKRHLTVVLISGTESEQTRTYSVSFWQILGVTAAGLFIIVAVVTATIVYTPLGSRLPISNPKLEREYGGMILQIRDRMEQLIEQANDLKLYNLKLRRAMGETVSAGDSALIDMAGLSGEGMDGIDTALWTDAGADEQAGGPGSGDPEQQDPDVYISGRGSTVMVPGSGIVDRQPAGGAGDTGDAGRGGDGPAISTGIPLSVPAEGFLTREFDPEQLHFGIDFAAKEGSPVWAAAPGVVLFAGWTPADGNMMMIAHSLGYVTVYKHNKTMHKTGGQEVRRGELIAAVGNTGRSTGPHLHFEVWRNGAALDAGRYILGIQ